MVVRELREIADRLDAESWSYNARVFSEMADRLREIADELDDTYDPDAVKQRMREMRDDTDPLNLRYAGPGAADELLYDKLQGGARDE